MTSDDTEVPQTMIHVNHDVTDGITLMIWVGEKKSNIDITDPWKKSE